jgi:hypothetical protein
MAAISTCKTGVKKRLGVKGASMYEARQEMPDCRISSDWTHLISSEWDHPISG